MHSNSIKKYKGVFIVIAHFDGASERNPGPAGISCVIIDNQGEIIWKRSEAIENATNNEAEYRALIALARQLVKMDAENVIINGDSQLVINRVNGNWKINHLHLYELCKNARGLLAKIKKYQLC